jgi:hypothetical protein
MITFATPKDDDEDEGGYLKPAFFIPYFKQSDVKLVIRLNHKLYDESEFTSNQIDHKDS